MVQLDVFAGGDVPFLQRRVLFGDVAEAVQHIGGYDAAGQLDADHLHVGLPLAVHALAQTEGRENGVVQFAGAEAVNFGVKALNFILHEGDDGAGVFRQFEAGRMDVFQAGGLRLGGQDGLLGRDTKNPTVP